ncbi:hypothetical protein AQPE_0434 [Aquipluma nitroreducens]|uniref:Uncharacterized protein n=1 Tax=Aquipluma nitroreducens TaxID=2010828 RepID=A0A5K7S471_9BACT|nr:hypothetical protein [Aquipluma nitroreducens]BBE16297.1 hypothetical protein AQPE_0434 [Aquipluma nitroreducens]
MSDWDQFEKDAKEAAKIAAEETNEILSTRIASITSLTPKEITELFPAATDAKNFEELVKIVRSAEGKNIQVNRIMENSEKFGGIILKLLTKFI